MRTVILADGVSKPQHLENRHFIKIGGEPLLKRTVRQFAAFSDVVVIASDRRYSDELADEPCEVFPGDGKTLYYEADMIRKGLNHREAPPSYLVFGDVYFTDAAIMTIASGNFGTAPQDWCVYGRSTRSLFTKTPWAEYFCIELGTVSNAICRAALTYARKEFSEKRWYRCSPWEWYFRMERMSPFIANPALVTTGPHWVEIHDETDDIDFLDDARHIEEAIENKARTGKGGET